MRAWTTPVELRRQARRLWERGVLLSSSYPLRLRFAAPTVAELSERFAEARDWIRELAASSRDATGFGYDLIWAEREYRQLGRNRVPSGAVLPSRDDAARLAGVLTETRRYDELLSETQALMPELATWVQARPLRALEHRALWERLTSVVRWLHANPSSGLYTRQIDLPGVDTKLIEQHRGIIDELLRHVRPAAEGPWEERWGLRRKPVCVRFRRLDERRRLRAFSDLTVPLGELAAFHPEETHVFITENELNGLSFPSRPETLVIFGLGYGVSLLEQLPWLAAKTVFYWGDIDTHGFAMLDRARAALPGVHSFLMDRDTLLAHRAAWVREPRQVSSLLMQLNADERALYDELLHGTHGDAVRLEQERVGFGWLMRRLGEVGA